MTDTLRTRISAVLNSHVAAWYYDCCPEGEKHVGEWSPHVADAVIRELGLKRASRPSDYGHVNYPPGYQYITDWIADE